MALGTKTRGAVTVTRTYCTRALGRKRVVTDGPREPADADVDARGCCCATMLVVEKHHDGSAGGGRKKRLVPAAAEEEPPCYIELLPHDLLVRILCGVHHSDLDQLMFVSKAVREAALIAKKTHFAFSTPTCKPAFTRARGVEPTEEDTDGFDDDDNYAPNAPRRSRKCESKLHGKRFDSLAVALFAGESDDGHNQWSSGSMLIDF